MKDFRYLRDSEASTDVTDLSAQREQSEVSAATRTTLLAQLLQDMQNEKTDVRNDAKTSDTPHRNDTRAIDIDDLETTITEDTRGSTVETAVDRIQALQALNAEVANDQARANRDRQNEVGVPNIDQQEIQSLLNRHERNPNQPATFRPGTPRYTIVLNCDALSTHPDLDYDHDDFTADRQNVNETGPRYSAFVQNLEADANLAKAMNRLCEAAITKNGGLTIDVTNENKGLVHIVVHELEKRITARGNSIGVFQDGYGPEQHLEMANQTTNLEPNQAPKYTVGRTPAPAFGENAVMSMSINMQNGGVPSVAILKAIRDLHWSETLTINSTIQIDQRGLREDPELYGHIVGQAAMSDTCFGKVSNPNSAVIATGFVQGSLQTTLAAEKRIDLMSLRDANLLGLTEHPTTLTTWPVRRSGR